MDKIIIYLLLSCFLVIAHNEELYHKNIKQEKNNIQKKKFLSTIRNVNFLIESLHYDNNITELKKIKLLIKFNQLKISIFEQIKNKKKLLSTNIEDTYLRTIDKHLIKIYSYKETPIITKTQEKKKTKKQQDIIQNKVISYFINNIYKKIIQGKKEEAKMIYLYLKENFSKKRTLFEKKIIKLLN